MPLTNEQHGVIAEDEFAKLVMMGSGGKLELGAPLTDEERRDFDIHVHGQFDAGLAVQVKSSLALLWRNRKTPYLHTFMSVRTGRVFSHPLYWYFIAYLDQKLMRFGEPTFLIPSVDFHKYASPSRRGGVCRFTFQGSMAPQARDRWQYYRVAPLELGDRVLQILRSHARARDLSIPATQIRSMPDVVWVHRRPRA